MSDKVARRFDLQHAVRVRVWAHGSTRDTYGILVEAPRLGQPLRVRLDDGKLVSSAKVVAIASKNSREHTLTTQLQVFDLEYLVDDPFGRGSLDFARSFVGRSVAVYCLEDFHGPSVVPFYGDLVTPIAIGQPLRILRHREMMRTSGVVRAERSENDLVVVTRNNRYLLRKSPETDTQTDTQTEEVLD